MKKEDSIIIQYGKALLNEYNEIKETLKEAHVYSSLDVARICKLAKNVGCFSSIFLSSQIKTIEEKHMIRDVENIYELIDASLTGRAPFQAIMSDEMAKRFETFDKSTPLEEETEI